MRNIRILMGNDDGIESIGLQMLARELAAFAEIIIVAPDRERSSSSSSLTLRRKLYLKQHNIGNSDIEAYSFSGMPADCAKFALGYLLAERLPDLIISGINNGYNCGSDAIYSGTVAVAMESVFYDIPALAVSGENFDREFLERAVPFTCELVQKIFIEESYRGLLNLNIPNVPDVGWDRLVVCKQGLQEYTNAISRGVDEEGKAYYSIAGKALPGGEPGDDVHALYQGYCTLTPLHWSQTATARLEDLQSCLTKIR